MYLISACRTMHVTHTLFPSLPLDNYHILLLVVAHSHVPRADTLPPISGLHIVEKCDRIQDRCINRSQNPRESTMHLSYNRTYPCFGGNFYSAPSEKTVYTSEHRSPNKLLYTGIHDNIDSC
jgi:hypothetical protein